MATLAAGRVLRPDGTLRPGVVEVDGRTVTHVSDATGPTPDRILTPGFIDLQVNGIADLDVATADGDEWGRLDELLVSQGVTTWCPTLISAPLASYPPALERISRAAGRPASTRPAIAGAHLEGPFLGTATGAHPRAFIVAVDRSFLDALPPIVRVVTMAPESEGALDAIRALAERGVLVSLGHSTADADTTRAAVAAGAKMVTHLFNAMVPFHHRQPGLIGVALTDDRLAVSLIADGVHIGPEALALALRAKRPGGLVLVTDAVAWQRFDPSGGAPRLADGTLAGSALTMDQAIRNTVSVGGNVTDALLAATATPAALLGLVDRGRLAPGTRADVVALSPALEVEQVWIGGEAAFP